MIEVDTIHQLVARILRKNPGPVTQRRLIRDLLQRQPESAELTKAALYLQKSRWCNELERAQWSDGSWGRLRTQNYSPKQKISTTETCVDRAFALGLDPVHPILRCFDC